MQTRRIALLLALLMLLGGVSAWAQTPDDYFNMLLMVTEDAGEPRPEAATGARAGTLVLLSLDKTSCQMRLLSIDGKLVTAEGETLADTNAISGPDMTRQAVNTLLGLDVPYYAMMSLDAMQKIVDSMGGVELDVLDTDLSIQLPNGNPAFEGAGVQLLSGAQIRVYLNVGESGPSDDEALRAERKQKALSAMMKRALSGGKGRLISFGVTALMNMETNVGLGDLMPLAEAMTKGSPGTPEMERSPLTGADTAPEGLALQDPAAESEAAQAFLYPDLAA